MFPPMPVRLYAHLTWTTLRRLPLLNPEVASFLHRFLRIEAKRHGVQVLETGIVANHVHAIIQLPLSSTYLAWCKGSKAQARASRTVMG